MAPITHTSSLPALLAAIIFVGCLTMAAADPATFYVSPEGDDQWTGTLPAPNEPGTDGPFATLERARDALRDLKQGAGLPVGGGLVVLTEGVYERRATFELTEADSGTPEAPVVFRAAPGAQVRISGGRTVPPEAFRPEMDDEVVVGLKPEARGKVLCADLTALGITDLGEFPTKYRGAPPVPELFFDEQRMTLARWPNGQWATIGKIIDSGSDPRNGDSGGRPGVFEYTGDAPARWSVEHGVWLQGYWCFDWYDETLKVKSIDAEKRQITFAEPHLYSVKQGNPSPRRYYALNLLEELDEPGEFYIDRERGAIYFWPPADIAGAQIVLSTLNAPLISVRNASNVILRGLTLEAGLANGIDMAGGAGNRVQACTVRNMRQNGISVNGGQGHRVEACDIHDTGTGGLTLAGGDRKTLSPGGHEALNNHIWRFSMHQLAYANGLTISGVGNRAAHNLLHDAPHQAVAVGGNDNIFEYNVVHHICMETDDCGAFYKGRDPSMRGNIVRYNFWHNIGSPMGHGNAAVYFDDGDGGETVFGNVFFRCGEPGRGSFGTVFSHGGHDIVAENNIFIECKRALGSAPWNDAGWKRMIDGDLWQQRLLKDVDITKPPYTTRYPELVGFMDPQPGAPRVSRATRNVIAMCASPRSGNWQVDEAQNWITATDPGFVDASTGDFRLRPDAEVFAKLPGFQPIPFEKMGLYADELRPHPPVEQWTYPPPIALPPLATAAAPQPTPKTGPPPVFQVRPATAAVTVDGAISPEEWGGAKPETAMLLAQHYTGEKTDRTSLAWLAYSEDALFIAVDSKINPATKLTGSQWGADDAIEVALRAEKSGPIQVVRAYGNGRATLGVAQSAQAEPVPGDAAGLQFAARRVDEGRWTAELRIPFAPLGVDPQTHRRLPFSLTVRKAQDNLWVMWEGTRGNSFNVDQAGLIELAQ